LIEIRSVVEELSHSQNFCGHRWLTFDLLTGDFPYVISVI